MNSRAKPASVLYKGRDYTVAFQPEFRQLRLGLPKYPDLYYWLAPLGRADAGGKPDAADAVPDAQPLGRSKRGLRVMFAARSSIWERRDLVFDFTPDGFECFLRLRGRGALDRLYFFTGLLPNSEVVGSVPGFDAVWPGAPNFLGRRRFAPNEFYSISVGLDTTHWGPALASGPLCYAFGREGVPAMFAAGVLARTGANLFDAFDFNYQSREMRNTLDNVVNTQALSLAYFGHQEVSGEWESPRLAFRFGKHRADCLEQYCALLEERGAVPKAVKRKSPAWWRRPIFCGWHEQCAVGRLRQRRETGQIALANSFAIMSACTQANYESWLELIRQKKLPIGTLIIDAKWQKQCGDFEVDEAKFPDMRGFIDRCHQQGLKVLLWLSAWTKEGLREDECMTFNGQAVAMDPTNSTYGWKLREGIRHLLGDAAGCLNADGLKIDGSSSIPTGPLLRTSGNLYGFELQRFYLDLVYKTAKAVKPEALISVYVANPYFRDVCDMVRLGDLYSVYGRPEDTARERAGVYAITMKHKLVDTDGWLRFSLGDDLVADFALQAELGVPTLYQIRHLYRQRPFVPPAFRELTKEEYQGIRQVLERYNRAAKRAR